MRKRKALKGGYIITNPASAGPILKEGLISRNDNDINSLHSIYQIKYNEAKRDLDRLTQLKKINNDAYDKYNLQKTEAEKNTIAIDNLSRNKNKDFWSAVGKSVVFITKLFIDVFKIFLSLLKTIGTFIVMGGQGAIIKVLIVIFILLVAIGFITSGFSGVNSKDINSSSDVGKDILKRDNDDYITNLKETNNDRLTRMHDWFKSLLPNSYKMGFSSISNSLTYITTGKNQFDEYLDDRDDINTGRSDNIFHVNFTDINPILSTHNINKDNTYSIIEPKDVILEFNENLYYNSDYSKITKNIKDEINYPTKCAIPIIPNSSGKYSLNIANIKYYNTNNELISDVNKNALIKPIFKKEEGKDKNTGVKLNSFNNYLYTNYFNAKNALGTYGTRLINPNYKGPILRLSQGSASDPHGEQEIYTENENKKGRKTMDFYNDYNTNLLYAIIDNKKIDYNNIFTTTTNKIYAVILYDQSNNNNNHLKFNKLDFKWPPEFNYNNNIYESQIYFYNMHMLMFTEPITYKKLNIYTKFKFNNLSFTRTHDSYFLSTKRDPVIIIKKEGDDIVFKYKENSISKAYKPSDTGEQYLNIDINNPETLECLGNNVDNRSKEEYYKDSQLNAPGDELKRRSKENSLIAYIYELIIYKSDD
jgi:hypothetical protein